jgi:MoaA/NifB/PqqE/SkfB family radical SAM enzyme
MQIELPYPLKLAMRQIDDKPIAAHLYVTDNCNLDCFYCTEYDNEVPHPSLSDLKKWIQKIKDLGCVRIGLQGGEPLLHPDIIEIVRFCKSLGLRTSMSTNGFKLSKEIIAGLEDAQLDSLQVSVDRMTPTRSTRKSVKSIMPKIELLKKSKLNFNITGVLFIDSLSEAKDVLEYGMSENIPVHARLVHAGPLGQYDVEPGKKEALEDMIDFQIREKRKGRSIRTTGTLFDYQKSLLNGQEMDWTCVAGYKYIFVTAQGKFWLCSMNRTPGIDIMDVTPEMLKSYNTKKSCQSGCGVYCVVSESFANNRTMQFVKREAEEIVQHQLGKIRSTGNGNGNGSNGVEKEAPVEVV